LWAPRERRRPRPGAIPTSLIHSSPWWRSPGWMRWHIAAGFRSQRARGTAFLQRPSGRGPHEAVRKGSYFPGEMIRPHLGRATRVAGKQALSRSGNHRPTPTDYSTFARTCTNGATTGTGPTITLSHRIGILKDREQAREKLRAEVLGGIRSRFHDARRVLAYRRNSDTQIMASVSFAKNTL
jgi:hypothetical protein